jgi:voltage-gated potassium channel Kch
MDGVEPAQDLSARVLLIGFGRVGQIVSQPLLARGHSLSIIDVDAEAIRSADDYGFKVWYGDGSRLDILHAAGAGDAGLIIAAAGDPRAVTRIVEIAKAEFPLVPVLARAFDREHALELVKAGTDFQIRETFESALVMGREALLRLGDDADLVEEMIANMRERDMNRFALECVGGIFAGRDLVIFNKPEAEAG